MTLKDISKGKKYMISGITENGSFRQKLLFMGLTPGAQVKLMNISPFGDPIAYKVRDFTLSLRRSEAEKILVKEIDN